MRLWLISIVLALVPLDAGGPPPAPDGPRFDGERLLQPVGYDTWPIVGASIGLSYAERVEGSGPGMFHRVYINPTAYATFRATGAFPNGTILVLEMHETLAKKSIAQGGYFEGARMGLEASVKDSRQKDGWAYYGFENGALASAKAFPDARCHSCHEAHGDVDSVFVQFYPNLRK